MALHREHEVRATPSRHPAVTWPFAEPPDVAALTCWRILRGEDWIHFVSHDEEDGAWHFHPHGFAPPSKAAVVALREIVAVDPSIGALADLPVGWCAWRDTRTSRWHRERISANDPER